MTKLASIVFCILFGSLFSQTNNEKKQEWTVTSSTVKFSVKNAGFTVTGSFSGLKAKVVFDSDECTGSSIVATIDAGTIATGNATRDEHLRKSEYFNVSVFPVITMQSMSIAKETAGSYKAKFRLSIKGITKDIVVPFKFSDVNDVTKFVASFSINRTDFGVGKSSLILSDKVDVTVILNVNRK